MVVIGITVPLVYNLVMYSLSRSMSSIFFSGVGTSVIWPNLRVKPKMAEIECQISSVLISFEGA